MSEVLETLEQQLCGAPTEKGPCTMKKGHSANFHRHQVYDTVEWQIYAGDGTFIISGSGRLGLQYGLNAGFEVSNELLIKVKNANSGSSNSQESTPAPGA